MLESVAVTVKLNVPAAVGVPAMIPCGERFRPLGSAPRETTKVKGAAPPVPFRACR